MSFPLQVNTGRQAGEMVMSGTMIELLDLNDREAMDAKVLQRKWESWKEDGMFVGEVLSRRSRAVGVS
jgi:hypothetical protein